MAAVPAEFNEFFNAYVEAALFTSNDESDESGGEPMDKHYGPRDIVRSELAKMARDCRRFIRENYKVIAAAHAKGEARWGKWALAGHDFWLTRNGHGAGFWDGDWSEPAAKILDASSKKFGEQNLYLGDDKRIYVYP